MPSVARSRRQEKDVRSPMRTSITTVDLGLQLASATGLVLLMVILHSVGLIGISRILRLKDERLLKHELDVSAFGLLGAFGVLLFALHIVEIVIFALFYVLVGAMDGFEAALFYSASAYATLGWTADYFPPEWRLIGALEALIGFVLIGWSTAFMVSTMQKLSESR
jgi:hypothetical protein